MSYVLNTPDDQRAMLAQIGVASLDELFQQVPAAVRLKGELDLAALTRSFAVELGTRNPRVRVNCILPGPVMLPPDMPQAEREQSINATLVKREGTPQHIAQAVLFLVDNDFVTGVCVPVDGGRSVFAPDSL